MLSPIIPVATDCQFGADKLTVFCNEYIRPRAAFQLNTTLCGSSAIACNLSTELALVGSVRLMNSFRLLRPSWSGSAVGAALDEVVEPK